MSAVNSSPNVLQGVSNEIIVQTQLLMFNCVSIKVNCFHNAFNVCV